MKNTFRLTAAEAQALDCEVVGQGGFQSFMRRVQGGLHGTLLTLSDRDLGRAIRHIRYGRGGYESRLRTALFRPLVGALNAPA